VAKRLLARGGGAQGGWAPDGEKWGSQLEGESKLNSTDKKSRKKNILHSGPPGESQPKIPRVGRPKRGEDRKPVPSYRTRWPKKPFYQRVKGKTGKCLTAQTDFRSERINNNQGLGQTKQMRTSQGAGHSYAKKEKTCVQLKGHAGMVACGKSEQNEEEEYFSKKGLKRNGGRCGEPQNPTRRKTERMFPLRGGWRRNAKNSKV